MPALQTSYTQYMRPAIAGMIADTSPQEIVSKFVQTSGGMGFGVVACQGTADNQVVVSAATIAFIGVSVLDPTRAPVSIPTTINQYEVGALASIMLRGTVWVLAGATITAGALAGYTPASGAFVLSTTSGATAIFNGRYDTSAASGALVKLRLI
jgi:hypothetical protein